jgi:uncharacterized protein (DUF58 family)
MLTNRGWWFFAIVLALLAVALGAGAGTVTLIALTLLAWFLGQWLAFTVRTSRLQAAATIQRAILDDNGPVKTLWARLPVTVRVSLRCAGISIPFVSMVDRVPVLARRRAGDCYAEGALGDSPLEALYRVECPSPGRLRFEGVQVRCADLQGFFAYQTFIRAVEVYRVLPPLAGARGHIPAIKRHNLIPLMGNHPHRRPGSGSELLDLRDYLPGDPPKTIAWKASARRDRLMTKEFESEVPVRCTLFVDTSNSVRVGMIGDNALARLVEIAAAVTQANASARDLTGLCLFDEDGIRHLVRPSRGSAHLVKITNLLTDAADLFPQTNQAPLARLLPLAYGVLQDLYPDWLDANVNSWPFWLPFWSPQPWYTTAGPRWKARWWWVWPFVAAAHLLTRLRPRTLLSNFFHILAHQQYRWRKQVAAVLSVHYGLGPGGLALLLEDDEQCGRFVGRFLTEHQVPCPLPFYDARGRYLFGSPAKIDILASAVMYSVLRGRDNELFVLLVDFLETGPHLEKILRAVRVALGRHHQVLVVCPWPPGVDKPKRAVSFTPTFRPRRGEGRKGEGRGITHEAARPLLQDLLAQASTLRLQQAFARVQQAFARLGVPVLCAPEDEAVGLILQRMQRLRALERGVR